MGGRAGRPTYKTAVAPVDEALLDSNIYRSYYHRRVVDPDAILVLIGVDGRISELRSMILSIESGDGRPARRRRQIGVGVAVSLTTRTVPRRNC